MEGVISTQDLGYHPYYKKLGKTNDVIQCHRYDIFHIWLFLSAALVINPGYMLGIITRPAINRQDTLNLLYAETGWIKHDYKSPAFINLAWLSAINRQYDDKLSSVY